MASLIRHGGNAHWMRPDRVYRTGVLAPMVGYQPQADVNAVAQEFSQGPARGMQLSGLGAPGPLRRLGLRIKAAIAQRQARRFMQISGLAGFGMPGGEAQMATQIAPHLAHQMAGVMHLMQGRYGSGYPATPADALVEGRLNSLYFAR